VTWAWLAHLQCRELHWGIQENRFPQTDKGFKLRVTSGVVFQHCARTDYVRSLLGDKYEVYDVTLSPSDWGHTCMKRPRFFTLVFRKEIVQVRRKPAVVLQQLCDTVKRQIQVFLSIGDYLEWTPTAHLQDQEPLLASFSPEALAGILSCSKTCIYRGSLSNVIAAGRYLSECEKIWRLKEFTCPKKAGSAIFDLSQNPAHIPVYSKSGSLRQWDGSQSSGRAERVGSLFCGSWLL
jgi:hypothetical protein